VIVDRLTKSAYFLPMKATAIMEELVKMYMDEIVRLHGTLVSIVSGKDSQFVLRF
jgi:hypothetical protein